eukprot:TRINITY_DN3845_c0_g1_i2.p1 TRINITY_DN3845_c0_g1~~TRINITY_DN3845_c0_g1_i2.p1  ORF type:complete len:1336 (-),score=262.38 TRINITY_DN3845_c0_g1_i2:474-4481(-)
MKLRRAMAWGLGRGGRCPEGIALLACLTAVCCVDVVKETKLSEGVEDISVVPTDKLLSVQNSKSASETDTDTSFLELLGIETQLNQNEPSVPVETTLNSISDVQTNTKINSVDNRDILTSSKEYNKLGTGPKSETSSAEDVQVRTTLSPTLSAEKLLSDENVSDSITLSLTNESSQSDAAEVETSQLPSTSSSSSSSIVISVPSASSIMSSSTQTPILPSAPTTAASDDITIVTTNPLNDDELINFHTVEHSNAQYSNYDFRAAFPQTVYEISPTTTLEKLEMTVPSYPRANPNRIGILDGETEDDSDHFLSHEAPLKIGGPLNHGRSSVDGIDQDNTRLLKKSNRRADPGPDINDILSGLLNVVGEGLHIATNYVQENNKRKQQEKLDGESSKGETIEDLFINLENQKKRNRTRTNNRGPTLLSAIPFEAIPLEVLNNRPGARPGVAIPQRPFQTRLPGLPPKVPSPPTVPIPSKKPSPIASGIPIPEQLVPTSESVKGSVLPSQLPTRSDYTPDFTEIGNDDETNSGETEDSENEISTDPLVTEGTVPTSQTTTTVKKDIRTKPKVQPLKAVPTDPYSDLYSTDFKNGKTTTSTQSPPIVIEPSFTPPLLVTPPSTPKIRKPLKRRPGLRPWGGKRPPRPPGRPPRPQQKWSKDNRPQSSFPTPPLQTTRRPIVFPTRQRNPAIVTGIAIPADNDIIELTVSANQNFGGSRKTKKKYQEFGGIITRARPGDQFVSIDGKRTYFDIEPTKAPSVTRPRPAGQGAVRGATLQIGGKDVYKPTRKSFDKNKYGPVVGSALPVEQVELNPTVEPKPYVPIANRKTTTPPRPGPTRRPPAPPVRIDTCIVGNDNTCKVKHHEICKTYLGVSSCYCKPGYGRKNHRQLCKKIVRLLMSMKIDRIQEDKIVWNNGYENQNTEEYQVLEGEVNYAIGSAMALTSFSNLYMGNEVNKFFSMNGAVTVNTTIEMEENSYTKSEIVKRDIKKKLIEVIQARANNIGSGNLYVAGPFNPIPGVEDFNECSEPEYNDCGDYSVCVNYFGGFTCRCLPGYGDRFSGDLLQSGRHCESCPADFCSNRGQCSIEEGSRICDCTGNYYGDQCQVDGEVLAVAIGASVAAVIIIILTLICLCMWSRRWKREQQKTDISRTFPHSYMVGSMPPPPTNPYMTNKMAGWAAQPSPAYHRGTIDSQLRWAHHLDATGQNIYAQPEPGSRRNLAVGGGRIGPLPSIPRPNTALGTRGELYKGNPPLIETSESEDTENNSRGMQQRPRSSSSMLAGNLNPDDDFESEYLRYGGTVGVRNPRLVAQMRGVPPTQFQQQQQQFQQQQHIQMNMMGARWS